MAGQKYTLTFDAKMEIGQIKSSMQQFQSLLDGLKLPQEFSKGIQKNIERLSEAIRSFETQASQEITSKGDIKGLESKAKRISDLFSSIRLQFRDLGTLSDKQLAKLFPKDVADNIRKAADAMKGYTSAIKQSQNAIEDNQNATKKSRIELAAQKKEVDKLSESLSRISKERGKVAQTLFKKTGTQDLDEAKKKLDELIKKREEYLTRANSGENKDAKGRPHEYSENAKARAEKELAALIQLRSQYQGLDQQVTEYTKALKKAQNGYDSIVESIKKYESILEELKTQHGKDQTAALEKLFKDLQSITGEDLTGIEHNLENAQKIIESLSSAAREKLVTSFQEVSRAANEVETGTDELNKSLSKTNTQFEQFDARAREVDALKTRIQYFFGLNNAIQLARRALNSAFNAIKDLDKAMTETAVVTNFTVSDMWSQLPEYTKRANELGVSTLQAYEASTLFYQQGLRTNEVVAISNETLKMARIAGLDAAEATDRMTNALRGFNMELNETSAQRVDDVYSKLAAITASNVDEISTAMTKVASLANNANMKFENTAAFLAQIIETTRESAETAGTALKTVIARFSEVKKLYSEDQLEGSDEEGEIINLNKISEALRIAGIDLNKYFLGEVGLDEIFIELAEKWDSLTNVQQRYIATQAAGSRQQSRFIALMSDYARTQELTTAAFNSSGAAAKQFEKTQDSLQSLLERLKNAWNEFAMGISNSTVIKLAIKGLTLLLKVVNSLTTGFGLLNGTFGDFISALLKISLAMGTLSAGRIATAGITASLVGKDPKLAMATLLFGEGSKATEAAGSSSGLKLVGQGFVKPFKKVFTRKKKVSEAVREAASFSESSKIIDAKLKGAEIAADKAAAVTAEKDIPSYDESRQAIDNISKIKTVKIQQEAINDAVQKAAQNAESITNAAAYSSVNAVEGATKITTKAVQEATSKITPIVKEAAEGAAKGAVPAIEKAAEETVEVITPAAEEVVEGAVEEVAPAVEAAAAEVAKKAGNAAEDIAKEGIEQVGEELSESIGDIVDSSTKASMSALKETSGKISSSPWYLNAQKDVIDNGLVNDIERFNPAVKKRYKWKRYYKRKYGKLDEYTQYNGFDYFSDKKELANYYSSADNRLFDIANFPTGNGTQKQFIEVKDSLKEIGDTAEETASKVTNSVSSITDSAVRSAGRVGDVVEEVAEGTGEVVGEVAEAIGDTRKSIVNASKATGEAAKTLGGLKNTAGKVIEDTGDAIRNTANTVSDLKNTSDQAAPAVQSLGAAAGSAGTSTAAMGSGAAAAGVSVAAIAVICVAAAAAITALAIAIKKEYDASVAGQLNMAKRFEESIDRLNNKLEDSSNTIKKATESYKESFQSIKELTYGTTEWADALEGVNDSVHQLLEAYPDLINYVNVTNSGVMEVSEEGLKQAKKEIEAAKEQANFLSLLAKGNTAQKTANYYKGGMFGQHKDESEASIQTARASAYYRNAFKERYGDRFNEKTINAIAETIDLNKIIEETGKKEYGYGLFLGKDFWNPKGYWQKEYEKETGTKADENWTTNQIVEQLSELKALDEIEKILTELNGKISEDNYKKAADIIGKNVDIDVSDTYNGILTKMGTAKKNAPFNYDFGLSDRALLEAVTITGKSGGGSFSQFLTDDSIYGEAARQVAEFLKTEFGLSSLTDNTALALYKAFDVDSIDEFVNEYFSGLLYIQDDYTEQVKEAQNNFEKHFTGGTDGAATKYKNVFENLAGTEVQTYGITAKQYAGLSNVITELGLAGATDEELKIFEEIRPEDSEKAKQYLQILSQMDPTDATSILSTFTKLENLGIDFGELGDSALEASNKIIKMAHASSKVDFEKLKEKTKDTSNFIKDIKERDSNNKTFTQEDFDKYIKGTGYESSFIYTGVEGQEYIYSGELNEIVRILQEQLNLEIDNAKATLDEQVKIGEQLQNDSRLTNSIKEVINNISEDSIYNGSVEEYYAQYSRLKEINSQIEGYNLLNIKDPEELKSILTSFLGYANNLDLLQKQKADFDKYTLIPQYTQKSLDETATSEEAKPFYNEILESKFGTDETALKAYDHILESVKDIGKALYQEEKVAKELSVVFSEWDKKLSSIYEKIKDNTEAIKAGDRKAAFAVADELKKFGLAQDEYTKELTANFVQQHIDELSKMGDSEEAWLAGLALIEDEFTRQNSSALSAISEEINFLDEQITNIPAIQTTAFLDISPFNKDLDQLENNAELVFAKIAAKGFAANFRRDKDGNIIGIDVTRINRSSLGGYSGGSSGGGGGKDTSWKNEQDRLYNLLQDIAEEQRKQTKLQEDYNRITSDPTATSQDIIKNLTDQLNSYKQLYGYQAARYSERERDLEEYQKENSEYGQYVWYNKDDKTVEYDWTLINSLKEADKEKYDKIVEIKGHLESLESDMDEADDSMREIQAQVRELQNVLRDKYIDFENRVRDALIASQQQVIDNYSELNDTLSQTASDILQSLQDEISLQRQIRDNTKTENDINQKEARLAYLRRDTTGKNQQEILQLEKELDESRQNYEDTLVDQAIERLQEENNKTVEQREHQIEIMQAQLDYQQKNGEFNEEVKRIINEGIDENGRPVQNSELTTLLKNTEGWDAMTKKERDVWDEELNKETAQVRAYLSEEIQTSLDNTQDAINAVNEILSKAIPGKLDAIVNAINGKTFDIPEYQTSVTYINNSYGGGGYEITGGDGQSYKIGLDSTAIRLTKEQRDMAEDILKTLGLNGTYINKYNAENALKKAIDKLYITDPNNYALEILYKMKAKPVEYATGGLNTKTGPAWLDGTLSRPEYVLNADQTQAFLKLANVLPQLLSSSSSISNTKVTGDIYLDLTMNVDEIGSDYDVDKIAERVKEIVYDASTYRNVNVINFTR